MIGKQPVFMNAYNQIVKTIIKVIDVISFFASFLKDERTFY